MTQIPEYVKQEARKELARREFWSFEKLLYPELFTEDRVLLKRMADTIQSFIEDSDKHYLVLSVPPGHYKSFTAKNLSLWLMGKDPSTRIIGVANSGDLASMFSTQIRDTILGINYGKGGVAYPEIFPDTKIKYGFATKSKWELEGASEPSYRATSPTSAITGSRADCLTGDTLVNTTHGMMRIDQISNGNNQPDILTYNHKNDTMEYERLVATRKIEERKVYEVILDNGTSFRGTRDHKVYVVGTGYRTLGWIKRNAKKHTIQLRTLRQAVRAQEIRGEQGYQEQHENEVLLCGLYSEANKYRKTNELLQMRQPRTERMDLLLGRLSKKIRMGSETAEYRLSELSKKLQASVSLDEVLLDGVQEQTSLKSDEDRKIRQGVPEGVQGHGEVDNREGRELLEMPVSEATWSSSPRWGQAEQQSEEPHNDVQKLSYVDAHVISVQECPDRESVYDIQTESNHNFFANGTLVHNCFIVDDIIKNHTEAMNPHALAEHFNFYKNTLFSRTDGDHYKFIFVMQRWATNDLSGEIMGLYGDDVVVVNYEIEDKDGNMLEPTIMSRTKFEEAKKTIDPIILKANYYQQPVDIEGRLYSDFEEYDTLPFDIKTAIVKARIDTADTGLDYFCGIPYAMHQGKAYILDATFSQSAAETTEPLTAKMLTLNNVNEATFESNNGGRGFARNIERLMKESGNNRTVVKWVSQNSNKEARILSSSAWVQNNVVFPAGWKSRWPEMASQALSYVRGAKNKHDDVVDVLASIYEDETSHKPVVYGKAR